jgi:hypothetical protein
MVAQKRKAAEGKRMPVIEGNRGGKEKGQQSFGKGVNRYYER